MSAFKKVAVIGGTGNVGGPVVESLKAAGFEVTIVLREASSSTTPVGVHLKKVNFESFDSVKAALEGQDAVVSTAAYAILHLQPLIIDAAIAAGVKRFIPSEYGINTRAISHEGLATILEPKVKTVDYLIEKSKAVPSFTWTGLATGLLFDWGLAFGLLGFIKPNKLARIIDSGDEPFSPTNVPLLARAIAAIVTHPDKTANKYLQIASFTTTQNEVLRIIEEETGEKWTHQAKTSAELDQAGYKKLSQGNLNAFAEFLPAYNLKDGTGLATTYEKTDNALLELEEDDIRQTIRAWLI